MLRRISALLCLSFGLSGCISGIEYGDVPHGVYVADPRCNPAADMAQNGGDNLPHFAVTSRLPNCQNPDVKLTDFRGDKLRYLRFGERPDKKSGKLDKKAAVPISILAQQHWWADLEQAARANNGRMLIYVHGYRESFTSSSHDAAQIKRLSGFAGPIIHYSWPSEHEFLSYAVDVANMEWDRKGFRGFLMALSQMPWAKDIIVISHSLGARLIIPSIAYVDRNTQSGPSVISTVMLMSPDADRRQFEREIDQTILSPRAVSAGRKLTIFLSAKDKALKLSRTIHGYPRLGNPYCFNPFRAQALKEKGQRPRCYAEFGGKQFLSKKAATIIDSSDVSGTRSGHSDYLRSAAACKEFAAILQGKSGGARLPTYLPYAFALPAYGKGEKPDHKAVCKRR